MKAHFGLFKKLSIVFMIIFLSILHLKAYAGQFTNTNINFSDIGADEWMALTFDPATEATLGIKANTVKNGIVHINENNYVATEGAGIYAGTEENKWPKAIAYFVTRIEASNSSVYKYIGINGTCTNLFYEGTAIGKVDLKLPNGNIIEIYVAKPTIGSFGKITESDISEKDIFDVDKDFSDGVIESSKYGKVEVLIAATVENVQFMFVLDKK